MTSRNMGLMKTRAFFVATVLLFILAIAWSSAPVVWFVFQSVATGSDLQAGLSAQAVSLTTKNYSRLFASTPEALYASVAVDFPEALANSTLIAAGSTGLALLIGTPAGLAIGQMGRRKWRLLGFIVGTRILPPVVLVIPVFLLASRTGLYDTRVGLYLVHAAIALPVVVAVIAAQVDPRLVLLWNMASLDGIRLVTRLHRIALPLLAPGVATATLLAFVTSWGEFFFALGLGGPQIQTAPVVLAGFQTIRGVQWGLVAAAATVMTIPVLVVAFALTGLRPLRQALRLSR